MEFDSKIGQKEMFSFMMNTTYRRATGIIWVIFSIVVVAVTIMTWGKVKLSNSLLMILLASLYTVINPVMLYFRAGRQVKNNNSLTVDIHFTLDEQHIKLTQDKAKETTPWLEVWKVVRYNRIIVIYVSSVRAFVIPVENLGDRYNEFVDYVSARISDRCKLKKAVQ